MLFLLAESIWCRQLLCKFLINCHLCRGSLLVIFTLCAAAGSSLAPGPLPRDHRRSRGGGKQHWHIWNPKLTNLLLSIASSCFLILWLDVEIPIINSLSNWQKDLRATNQHMRREEEYTYILFLVSSMCIFQLPTVQNKVLISPTTFPTPRPQRCCEAQARVRQGSARDGP